MKSLVFVLGWIIGSAFAAAADGGDSQSSVSAETGLVLEAPFNTAESFEDSEVSEAEVVSAHASPEGEDGLPLGEDSIPVFKKSAEAKAKAIGGREVTFITLAIGFTLLSGGFILMRRWVRKKVGKGAPLQIKIIGQHYLGPKKSLAVVRVAGESILIGITDHNISCIKALSLLDEELPAPDEKIQFSESLKKHSDDSFAEDEGENFSIAALTEIKDRVSSKLRELKELN
jgi:flagellar protein FliO/FliZ